MLLHQWLTSPVNMYSEYANLLSSGHLIALKIRFISRNHLSASFELHLPSNLARWCLRKLSRLHSWEWRDEEEEEPTVALTLPIIFKHWRWDASVDNRVASRYCKATVFCCTKEAFCCCMLQVLTPSSLAFPEHQDWRVEEEEVWMPSSFFHKEKEPSE